MVARKRKPGETFASYRKNLKAEAESLKQRLAGRMVFLSRQLNWDKGTGNTYRRNKS